MKKNIILLGGSNSVRVNGLQKGLREGIEKLNLALQTQNQTSKKQNHFDYNQNENNATGGVGDLSFIIWL